MPGRGPSSKRALFVPAAFLALAGLWMFSRSGAILDYAALAGRLESRVNELLVRQGVGDDDVRGSRREKRVWLPVPTSWVETEREVRVQSLAELGPLARDLKALAAELKLNLFVWDASGQRVLAELGRNGKVFQRLVFRARTASGAMPGPKAAIVIDDVAGRAYDLESLDAFLALGAPVTYAVLPMEKMSAPAADKIHASGQEVIVHQPMEPQDAERHDPGKSALLVRMAPRELADKLAKNFATVPHAAGISNHMGSRFTGDLAAMENLLRAIAGMPPAASGKPVFFLDSHTHPKPVGGKVARRLKVAYLRNDVFLDNVDAPDPMLRQLRRLRALAKKHGRAVAIGHIQRKHMAGALGAALPEFKRDGVELVRLSELLPETMEAHAGPGH